jgi:LPS-assembly protein
MRTCVRLLSLAVVVLGLALPGAAAERDLLRDLDRLQRLREAVDVDAEHVDYDATERRLVARGGVRFAIERLVISADEVSADLDDQILTARGRVLLIDGANHLEGESVEYNLRTGLGIVRQAKGLLSPGISVEGAEIRREGEREFRLLQGKFTSCRVCQTGEQTPDWEFRAAEATVHLDDYVIADHTSFWIKGLPALYAPRLIVPVSPRRTGFLIPRVGVGGRDGFKLGLPFFWALSPSQDVTFTPIYRTRRGPDLSAEYRYVLAEDSRGEMSARYLYDTNQERSRSEFRWKHDQSFTPTLSLKADVNYLSDDSLARDYVDSSVADRTQRTLPSNVFLTQATSRYMALGLVSTAQDLSSNSASRSSRLPELRFQWLPDPWLGARLLAEGDAAAAYLEREGSIDVGRFDLTPALHLPLDLAPGLSAVSSLSARETAYTDSPRTGGDTNRVFVDFRERLASRFLRRFALEEGPLRQLTHVVEPSLTYQYVPWMDQQSLPQFDTTDFVNPQNRLTLRLGNRLMARAREAEGGVFEFARLEIAQSVNLQPRTREFSNVYLTSLTPERVDQAVEQIRPAGADFSRAKERIWSNLVVSGRLSPIPTVALWGTVATNLEQEAAEGINAGLEFRWTEWLKFDLGHTYVRGRSANGMVARAEVQATKTILLDFLTRFEGHTGSLMEQGVGLHYGSCCWEMALKYTYRNEVPGRPAENDVKVTFDIKMPTPQSVRSITERPSAGR